MGASNRFWKFLRPDVEAGPGSLDIPVRPDPWAGTGEQVMNTRTQAEPRLLLDGLAFPESPRWHDGRLWFADWGAGEVISVDLQGRREVEANVTSFPMCIDHLPDGRLLIVASSDQRILRREHDGSLVTHADLRGLSHRPWNDIVVDGRGNAYVNNVGFDFPEGEFAPGSLWWVGPDGSIRLAADDLAFPNGMAVSPDGATLIVAESYGSRLTAFDIGADGSLANRRVWAGVEGNPDGICLDADGAVWFADVAGQRCVRVREGGEVLEVIDLDRGCFACALGGPDGRTLFLIANEWGDASGTGAGEPKGQVLTVPASAPAAS
jgi:sugar lactone lactonase YvrE